jgi:hypothetical protein
MLKIDNSLLVEIGLGNLAEPEKNSFLKHIYETLEMRVGIRLADQMSNEQLDEFERYFEAKDDAGAFKWLETNFPNYKDIVQQEFDKLKGEVAQSAPQILAASQGAAAAAPQAQPAQPSVAPQAPPPQAPQPQAAPMPAAQPSVSPEPPQPVNPAPLTPPAPGSAGDQPQLQPSPPPVQPAPPVPPQPFADPSAPLTPPPPPPQPNQPPFPTQQPPAGPPPNEP